MAIDVKATEKLMQNLKMEIQTIDVLVSHVLCDLRSPSPVRVNAARHLLETIETITASYR